MTACAQAFHCFRLGDTLFLILCFIICFLINDSFMCIVKDKQFVLIAILFRFVLKLSLVVFPRTVYPNRILTSVQNIATICSIPCIRGHGNSYTGNPQDDSVSHKPEGIRVLSSDKVSAIAVVPIPSQTS